MAININFNLRNPNSLKETPINIVIRYNGLQIVHPSGERIDPKYWESDNTKIRSYQRAKKSYWASIELNSRLDDISAKAQRIYSLYIAEYNVSPNRIQYKELLSKALGQEKQKDLTELDLFLFIKDHIERSKGRFNAKTGKLLSPNTIKPYRTLLRHLNEFDKKYNRKLNWHVLDNKFYIDFTTYLREKGLKVNSIGKQFQVLNSFIREAEELDIIPINKIKSFKVIREEVDSISLSEQELQEWQKLDLHYDINLEIARDLFTLACYTGSRYSDIGKFNIDNLKDINGTKVFIIIQQKTQQEVQVPVHPIVESILNKYGGNIPNIPPDQKMNKRLKVIAKMIPSLNVLYKRKYSNGNGIISEEVYKYDMVTTHTGRRTFASIQYMKGIPPQFIMSITGHKTEKDFYKYIRIPSITRSEVVYNIWQKDDWTYKNLTNS